MNFPPIGPGDFISAPVVIGPSPEYIADLERRKAVITRLCTALHEFLTLDIDAQLAQAARIPRMVPYRRRHKPTIEDLERAQREVERVQVQIDALDKLLDSNFPKEAAEYMNTLQRPMLESQLQCAQEWLYKIQTAIEEPEPDPAAQPTKAEE